MPGQPHRVTVIPGDGVGPEVVRSAQRIIDGGRRRRSTGRRPRPAPRSSSAATPPACRSETRDSIARTRVVLKGPLETPVGFGEKSANVTLRKLFETYANVRPARELPGVPTRYAGEGVDMIIVRENIEDLYAGIEHMQTPDVAQCLKIITRKGCEKIIRYAFELARREGRRKVTCATKANIMKLTEGLFKRVFEELARRVPGDRRRAPDHRQRGPPDGQGPGPVRRRRHHEPERRHHQRPGVGPGRRPGLRAVRQLRRRRRDLRGGPRLGAEVRRQGRHQPDRADPQLGDDAPPPRRVGRRGPDRGRGPRDARGGHAPSPRTWPARRAATSSRPPPRPGFTDAIIANLGRQPTTVPPRHGSERPSGEARPRPRWTLRPGALRGDGGGAGRRGHLHRVR